MIPRVLVSLLAFVLFTGCAPRSRTAIGDLPAAVARFERTMRVDVRLHGSPGEPSTGRGRSVEYGPVDPALVARFLPVMGGVLDRYPARFRAEVVPEILLVGSLRARGKPFLGMAHPRQGRLALALRPRLDGEDLAGTLHHEIAHLVQRHSAFEGARWRAFSRGAYVGIEPRTKWPRAERPWLQHGFVTRYASKNPGEDFAELVELAFTRPDRARRLAVAYPLIGRKLAFTTVTYRRIAPDMELPWVGAGWERWLQDRPARGPR